MTYDPTKPDSTSAAKDTPTYIREVSSIARVRREATLAALNAITDELIVGQLGWAIDTGLLYKCTTASSGSNVWAPANNSIVMLDPEYGELGYSGGAVAWTTLTLAGIPAGSKFAILEIFNASGGNTSIHVRKKGSSQTAGGYVKGETICAGQVIVEVDSSQRIEYYVAGDISCMAGINTLGYMY